MASKTNSNPMSYEGKNVVVTGGSSGVGDALVSLLKDLGASEITVLDLNEPKAPADNFIECDMGDPESIDKAADQIKEPLNVLFNNAGIAANFPAEQVMRVNIMGLIRLTKALVPKIPAGGAVVNTASIAGMNWIAHQANILEFITIDDWDKQVEWVQGHAEEIADGYMYSKECLQIFTMHHAKELMSSKIRIASACPAPIDTPLLDKFKETMGEQVIDWTTNQATGEYVTSGEVANLLAYLGSDAASYISGANVNIDAGFQGGVTTGTVDFSTMEA